MDGVSLVGLNIFHSEEKDWARHYLKLKRFKTEFMILGGPHETHIHTQTHIHTRIAACPVRVGNDEIFPYS